MSQNNNSLTKTTYGTDNKSKILKRTHPYKLSLIDSELNTETSFYLDDDMADKLYQFLKEYNKQTNSKTENPYVITEKTFNENTENELKELLHLNKNIILKDFLITSDSKAKDCININHIIKEINVEIPIVYKNGNSGMKIIKAHYCENCKLYFISSKQFQYVSQEGTMLCQHMTWEEYIDYIKNAESKYMNFSRYSLLRRVGYTVSSETNLTKEQRQSILSYVIEQKPIDEKGNKWDKEFVIWFIEQQLSKRKDKSYLQKAVLKWEEDLEFLSNYNHNHPVVYRIRNLIY